MAGYAEHLFSWPEAHLAKPSVKPSLEELTERIVPSASASSMPTAADVTPQMVSRMASWVPVLVTLQSELSQDEQALFQVATAETAYLWQQWEHLLGINANTSPTSSNAVVPQPSNSSGSGNGSSSPNMGPSAGESSGSAAATAIHNAPDQEFKPAMLQGTSSGTTAKSDVSSTSQPSSGGVNPYYGTGSATVSGQVWLDNNGDGLLDNGETGMSGITVYLCNAQGQQGPSTTTDTNGNYQFQVSNSLYNLPNQFEIQVVIPNGDVATVENASGSGINSNINANGYSSVFTLAANGTQQVNAGLAPEPIVSGQVWLDNNGDDSLDDGEMGFSGITVNLDSSTGQQLMTTTTDNQGNYQFAVGGALLSQYSSFEVQVALPSGDEADPEDADSDIDANGLSPVFALAPGGAENVPAGIRSLQVTTTQDDDNGRIQNQITLRDAIETAEWFSFPTITFKSGLSGTIELQEALVPLDSNMIIAGPGASQIQVTSPGTVFAAFLVRPSRVCEIDGLGISGFISSYGGAINNAGTLTLVNDVISNNTAEQGGGIYNSGSLNLVNDVISGNKAPTGDPSTGAGIYNALDATAFIHSCTITGNIAQNAGGGIDNEGTMQCYYLGM